MALHESLNLRRDEVVPVLILVVQSVFLGFFLGAFDVGANTLFLNSFTQDMIPKAIVISGITGIVLTSLYSFFQNRLQFSTLAAVNLFTVFIITFLLRAGYYFSDTKWLAFALFVLMGPLNIVALVGFWGTVGRIFDLRQGKRIFGFIDTGQVVGVIISSFSIPFLVTIGMQTKNLLYISAVSMFFAVIFQLIISSKYPERLKVKSTKEAKSSTFADTFKIPYVRTMALFVIFSMLIAFFVHYLFLAVAGERFDNPEELAKYFGGLMGSLTFVSVLIKAFVYGPLMKTYGLKISLLVSPIVMMIITLCSALVGSFFGYTLESASFTFFFLLISLSKFFQKALKDSIESPVLKLIYQSLPPSIRHEVQARVDGTINETAALASGVILTVLGLFSFINLIHYSYFLIGFIFIWFFISLRLFKGYRKTLKETLDNASKKDIEVDVQDEWLNTIEHIRPSERLKLVDVSKPWLLHGFIEEAVISAKGKELELACEYIEQKALVNLRGALEKRVESALTNDDKQTLSKTLNYLNELGKISVDEIKIKELLSSKNFDDRVLAAKLIGVSSNSALKQSLTFLLRDLVPQVKKQAIWAARGTRSKELISFLIDFLDKDDYAPLAHAALMQSGEIGLEMLMLAFNRSGASDNFRKRIIRIIPDTGSVIAQSVLFSKLSIHSNLKTEVLDGLLRLDFTTDDRESLLLHQMLVEQAGVCAWNLNLLHHCPPEDKAPHLKDELEYEYSTSRHNLFQLLKLQYDKSSIDAVIENLDAGTGESISFAIELLDTFVIEDLKPYIFPLLEDASLSNKIWALQSYFPLREYTHEELLKAVINRNENIMGKRAKIYALNAFRNLENLDISADLAAQLFNTDKVLRQLSAQLVQEIDGARYMNFRKRLNDKLRVELDRNLEIVASTQSDALERLSFFCDLPYSRIHTAPLFWLYNASTIKLSDIDILSIGLFSGKEHIMLVESGTLTLSGSEGSADVFESGNICITKGINQKEYKLMADGDVVLHYIDYNKFLAELYNHDYLIDFLL